MALNWDPASELFGIEAGSARNTWAVGAVEIAVGRDRTLIEHWNGTGWSVVPSPNLGSEFSDLHAIDSISPRNIWAVGGFGNTGGHGQTLIQHWNGTSWSVVPSPNPGSAFNTLLEIKRTSARDIWAVGDYHNMGGPFQTLIEHWNGAAWSVVPCP